MGVGFDSLTMEEAVARARDLMAERRAAYVVTPNPEIVMLCREDAAAMQAVQNADLVLADGIGVIYGAKILGTPLRAKLPGIDFAVALMTQMGREGKSVFLLGAKPGVADAAGEKLRERFPGLVQASHSLILFLYFFRCKFSDDTEIGHGGYGCTPVIGLYSCECTDHGGGGTAGSGNFRHPWMAVLQKGGLAVFVCNNVRRTGTTDGKATDLEFWYTVCSIG